ncbi:MAG: phosphate acyltransferase PlsX [Clostridia bacterium]|nr:phosphate acyltransferase PlsX [Clostridia bacterium]
MRIIVDAYGGDNAPLEIIKGAALAVAEYGHTVVLTGKEDELRRIASENQVSLDGMEIIDCDDVISMDDAPRTILREHKNCSMAVGLRALSEGKGDAFVSAGSTGALLVGGTFIVKRIKGISRAALAALIPTNTGAPVMLVDAGANVDCRPKMLYQFARMGNIYMTDVIGGGKPARVGLLNVGTEDTKGGELQHEAFELLKKSDNMNFVGNIEARQVLYGDVDVLVADGFAGNVLLKSIEGTADVLMKKIKGVFLTNLLTKIAALFVKPHLGKVKAMLSTEEHGGAPLLGLKKPVIKAHGNSKAGAVKNAIRVAAEFASAGVIEKIEAVVSEDATEDDE